MKKFVSSFFLIFLFYLGCFCQSNLKEEATVHFILSAEDLRDKIRGGLLGQILGNLNGLPHEMEYIQQPGEVAAYKPALPNGAWTDDDTDFEWVYIIEMQAQNKLFLSSEAISKLWQERINQRIWCSNQYARQLMDLGLQPPLTGNILLNPWADFNISGQFLCETFGLLGPGLPQTASRIGLNYTRVAIDGEPAQTTQLFTTMIATAFQTNEVKEIIEAGVKALDAKSVLNDIIKDIHHWHQKYPMDWRITRQKLKEKYSQVNGAMRDKNGYELNTGSTIAALLYGNSDFTKTLQMAFNFGWDCDNSAATAGTILGVTKGYRWMMTQGWQIVDRYKNTTRGHMPENETITSFADRLIELAEKVIIQEGGKKTEQEGKIFYTIMPEPSKNIAPLYDNSDLLSKMQREHRDQIIFDLKSNNKMVKAKATYLGICLQLYNSLQREFPKDWSEGIQALHAYEQVLQVLFHHSPVPAAKPLRELVIAAGVLPPKIKKKLW